MYPAGRTRYSFPQSVSRICARPVSPPPCLLGTPSVFKITGVSNSCQGEPPNGRQHGRRRPRPASKSSLWLNHAEHTWESWRERGWRRRAHLRVYLRVLRAVREATPVRRGGRSDGVPCLRERGRASLLGAQHQEDAHRPLQRHKPRKEERSRARRGATTLRKHSISGGSTSGSREALDARPLTSFSVPRRDSTTRGSRLRDVRSEGKLYSGE
jgi:hypothetical protein